MVEKVVADDFVTEGAGAGGTGYGQLATVEKPGSGRLHTVEKPGTGHPQTQERPGTGDATLVGPGTTAGPGGNLGTTERPEEGGTRDDDTGPDCDEIGRQMAALLATLEGIHDSNRDRTRRAVRAVRGTAKTESREYDGYAHWVTQAKITQAQVEGSNAAGKWMIDIGLFALGGWGGLGALSKGSSIARSTATGMQVARAGEGGALTFSRWHEAAQAASKLDKWLGAGIRGSKSTAEAYAKVATKILEKVEDSIVPGAGKGTSAGLKTLEKLDKEWWQGGLGMAESLARGAIIDGIGNWMKEGASAPAMEQAKKDYAEFAAQAAAANVDAASALGVEAKLRELAELAAKKNCPVPAIPNYSFYTFDVAQFGVGMSQGEAGPSLHLHSLEGNVEGNWDLFVQSQQTPFG